MCIRDRMEIDKAIQNLCKGKTVIVVAHRLSALKMCERVAVVEDVYKRQALSHQKKVEIPVEKPVLYQKCGNCKQTAYLKAKEKYCLLYTSRPSHRYH